MKVSLTILIVFFRLSSTALGQTYEANHIIKLVNSAKIAFCEGDTLRTIDILEAAEKLYPNDALIVSTNKALADLYLAKGRADKAKERLLYAFSYKPVNYAAYSDTDVCNKILNRHNYSRAKADLCVALSQIYLAQNQPDSSYYFLNLADNEFLPYKDCGNGICMYKSYLSPYFAQYYLATGDTSKAIARLLDFFMKRDGDTKLLTQKLKTILLQRWTQEQIRQEVDKGLRSLQFTYKGDEGFVINLTLFGYTIKDYGYGKTKLHKDLYRKDLSLKMLRGD